ncbi:MAG: ABC transporter permease [Sterolibacterium sp.]|jgi:peptide/nickel transport system permease protein|nr:ABC transporter permease [Sterolibacterium sp.]
MNAPIDRDAHAHIYAPSPGLWGLAWRRLKTDRLAMGSLAVVTFFLLLMLASISNLLARDWSREVGVNYAPPTWLGIQADAIDRNLPLPETQPGDEVPHNPLDPLASELAALKAQLKSGSATAPPDYGIADPLAEDLEAIRTTQQILTPATPQTRQATLPFGGDKWGRDILQKTIKGSGTSIFVGLIAALIATLIGTLLGALAGYFGGWMDDLLNWFYSIFTSIPYLLLILAIAAVMPKDKGLASIVLILGLTGWTGVFRLIRAEYLKHKSREYVLAADALGASDARKMFVHIFPNVSHVALVQLSLLVVGFIKAEVILSFLGFGVPVDAVSWGSMLNEAQNELILGKWWQLAAATLAMSLLVTAFSLLTDALRDALDPKLK